MPDQFPKRLPCVQLSHNFPLPLKLVRCLSCMRVNNAAKCVLMPIPSELHQSEATACGPRSLWVWEPFASEYVTRSAKHSNLTDDVPQIRFIRFLWFAQQCEPIMKMKTASWPCFTILSTVQWRMTSIFMPLWSSNHNKAKNDLWQLFFMDDCRPVCRVSVVPDVSTLEHNGHTLSGQSSQERTNYVGWICHKCLLNTSYPNCLEGRDNVTAQVACKRLHFHQHHQQSCFVLERTSGTMTHRGTYLSCPVLYAEYKRNETPFCNTRWMSNKNATHKKRVVHTNVRSS